MLKAVRSVQVKPRRFWVIRIAFLRSEADRDRGVKASHISFKIEEGVPSPCAFAYEIEKG